MKDYDSSCGISSVVSNPESDKYDSKHNNDTYQNNDYSVDDNNRNGS